MSRSVKPGRERKTGTGAIYDKSVKPGRERFTAKASCGMFALMPRSARRSLGGKVYHVLNRAALRYPIFKRQKDFEAFDRLLYEAHARMANMRVLAWCLMNNHWHLLLWPRRDGELSTFMSWLTMTHAARYRTSHDNVGYGPVYQGRYKSFIVQDDRHLLIAGRYIERNALRAGLVARAEDWRWSSLRVRHAGTEKERSILHEWPISLPKDWLDLVNGPQTSAEEAAMQISIQRSRPFGDSKWQQATARRAGCVSCFRNPGRPQKQKNK